MVLEPTSHEFESQEELCVDKSVPTGFHLRGSVEK